MENLLPQNVGSIINYCIIIIIIIIKTVSSARSGESESTLKTQPHTTRNKKIEKTVIDKNKEQIPTGKHWLCS